MIKQRIIVITLITFTFCILGAYTFYANRANPINYVELFLTSYCDLPCWMSFTPGKTSLESSEATFLLLDKKYRDTIRKTNYPESSNIQSKYFIDYEGASVELTFSENILLQTQIRFGDNNIKIDDVFLNFGEPTSIHSKWISAHNQQCYGSYLYYPEKGISVGLGDCGGGSLVIGQVDSSTPVISIHYTPQVKSTQDMILFFFDDRPNTDLKNWSGFGIYAP